MVQRPAATYSAFWLVVDRQFNLRTTSFGVSSRLVTAAALATSFNVRSASRLDRASLCKGEVNRHTYPPTSLM